jgi:hypothetical protein
MTNNYNNTCTDNYNDNFNFNCNCNLNNKNNHYQILQKEILENHSEIINRFYDCLHAFNM